MHFTLSPLSITLYLIDNHVNMLSLRYKNSQWITLQACGETLPEECWPGSFVLMITGDAYMQNPRGLSSLGLSLVQIYALADTDRVRRNRLIDFDEAASSS